MAYPPYPRGGCSDTTNATHSYTRDLRVDNGASYRQVLDVGNWDAATMTNAPGQSGDPRSPFYANLLEGWARDEAFPLIYSDAAIKRHTVHTVHLRPMPPGRAPN